VAQGLLLKETAGQKERKKKMNIIDAVKATMEGKKVSRKVDDEAILKVCFDGSIVFYVESDAATESPDYNDILADDYFIVE
jgi:hypothetical protein